MGKPENRPAIRGRTLVRYQWLMLSLLLTACGQSGQESAALAPVTVRVAPVEAVAPETSLRFAGVVRSRQRAELTFQLSGTLQERFVDIGDSVVASEMLARLYNPQLVPARDSAEARLRQAETQARQAEQDYQRGIRLREKGVLSEQDIEQLATRREAAEAAVSTARAALAEAEELLSEGTLRAPFSGIVDAVFAEPGEFVAAGHPVFRLSSSEGLEVEVRVPESLRTRMDVGQTLPVWQVMARDLGPLSGTVTEIGRGSRRGELYPVIVSLPASELSPGVSVEVGIASAEKETLSIPVLAVVRTTGGNQVYRVQDGRAERVSVSVLQLAGERVLVDPGTLSAGDQVVYAGLTRLMDGDRVEVLP